MIIRDSKEGSRMARLILLIDDNVLGPSDPLSITDDDDGYLIDIGLREVVTTRIRVWIKVKRDSTLLIVWQGGGQLKGLLIKVNSRMGLVKHALKDGQGVTIKTMLFISDALVMLGDTTIKSINKAPVVVDVELGISRKQTLRRNN